MLIFMCFGKEFNFKHAMTFVLNPLKCVDLEVTILPSGPDSKAYTSKSLEFPRKYSPLFGGFHKKQSLGLFTVKSSNNLSKNTKSEEL